MLHCSSVKSFGVHKHKHKRAISAESAKGHHDPIGDGGDHCGTKALGLLPSTFLFPPPLLPLADHHRLRIYALHFLLDRRNHRKFKSVCIIGGKSTLLVSSGKGQVRSGSAFPRGRRRRKGERERERGRVHKRPRAARGIVTGVTRVSRRWHANGKREKRGSIACVRRRSSPGPGKRVIYKYARRVEADSVVPCLMLSRKGKTQEGEWEF